eukprot:scaffold29600_cov18-Tisochrysis_lutea.AAC.1
MATCSPFVRQVLNASGSEGKLLFAHVHVLLGIARHHIVKRSKDPYCDTTGPLGCMNIPGVAWKVTRKSPTVADKCKMNRATCVAELACQCDKA